MDAFIKSPNLPEDKVTLAVVDGRVRKSIIEEMGRMGIEVIKADVCKDLYEAVQGHADMFMHHLRGKDIVIAPNAPIGTRNALSKHGFNLIEGDRVITRKYPGDIAYNVARAANYAICNKRYTDTKLLQCLHDLDIKIIDISQGYAKCSICIVNGDAFITSDEGIYKTLIKEGLDALKISPGNIELKGLDYGFIGGASGFISGDTLAFTGHLKRHPDYAAIKNFLEKHNKKIKNLDEYELMDTGTIIPLKEQKGEENC
ncbi:hypothetical protein OXPF_39080 [Oxobacter pfennigii]|uniref:DUF6873 domain-containing protein n=1 Tax=Oxobacter pfennigii TaxID=36849 RepID=A0A0P8WJ51_9CLOT|nr:hypothetical protein [Oxobacter pfennigii]KPU42129.1 hypothetical protein OXPF_39080 [Oxobacter pfennigii]